MAPISYYYLISTILAMGSLLWLINLLYLKIKGRTIYGQVYVLGSSEYKRVVTLASTRSLIITVVITLTLLANLIWSIWIVWRLNTSDAYFAIIFIPIAVASALAFGINKMRKEYMTSNLNKSKRENKDGKDDSWLS